jgi:signal transduction histidine kinase
VRLPRLLRTSSFRLAALFALIFGASTLVVGAFVYINVKAALDGQVRARIESDAYALKGEFDNGGLPDLMSAIRERQQNNLAGGLNYSLFTDDGSLVYGNLPHMKPRAGWRHVRGPPDGDEPPGKLERLLVFETRLSPKLWLFVGDDVGILARIDSAVLEMLTIGLLLSMALAIGGGIVVSLAFLRRIDEITRTAEAIIAGDIGRRIALKGSNDELDRLSATLNRMLTQISALMAALRDVSKDIAHDLRTPLGHLRQFLEETRIRATSEDEYARAIANAIAKTDAILETFAAILRITQIESGSRRASFRRFDLSQTVSSLTQSFAPAAEEQRHSIVERITPGIFLEGDRELITQLVVNLLDNAIRHTPQSTTINVVLEQTQSSIVLEIADNGPGVPVAERERIMDRFYRCEASRTTPGSGLGLSLADAVASLHHAKIVALDNQPGLRVRTEFAKMLPRVAHAA